MDRDRLIKVMASVLRDPQVLEAMAAVPRDLFVPEDLREQAWENDPLPIGDGQTISQPSVVARMCELLELTGQELVLDVGTGSGYHAAVLAQLCDRVISIERHPGLIAVARESLDRAGVENVELVLGDGSLGLPGRAPFGAINVAAAAKGAPPLPLVAQLADGARMVLPVDGCGQYLTVVHRHGDAVESSRVEPVRFVPLIEGQATG